MFLGHGTFKKQRDKASVGIWDVKGYHRDNGLEVHRDQHQLVQGQSKDVLGTWDEKDKGMRHQ